MQPLLFVTLYGVLVAASPGFPMSLSTPAGMESGPAVLKRHLSEALNETAAWNTSMAPVTTSSSTIIAASSTRQGHVVGAWTSTPSSSLGVTAAVADMTQTTRDKVAMNTFADTNIATSTTSTGVRTMAEASTAVADAKAAADTTVAGVAGFTASTSTAANGSAVVTLAMGMGGNIGDFMNRSGQDGNCSRAFKIKLFKVFFDEACLADLNVEGFSCPLMHAETFLSELFGELQVLSVGTAPLLLYFYLTLALLGNIPDISEEGLRVKLLCAVWLLLQLATMLFQVLSMVWYVLGYVNMHYKMGTCFNRVGGAAFPHLTILPVASFQMAAVNKMVPLVISFTVLLMGFFNDCPMHNNKVVRAILLGWLFLALPFFVGLIYTVFTLSIFFSVPFLPVTFVMLLVMLLLGVWLFILMRGFKGSLTRLEKEYNVDLLWFLIGSRDSPADSAFTVIGLAAVGLMLLAPLVALGTILAFAVYGGMDGGEVIGWAYEYVFAPMHFELHLPTFADFDVLFQDFPENVYNVMLELTGFLRLPPESLLVLGTTSGALGTVLSLLRSFILTANTVLYKCSDWGVPCKPLKNVLFSGARRRSNSQQEHWDDKCAHPCVPSV